MILFDVNILIYAHREDQIDHSYYQNRIEDIVRSGHAFGISALIAAGFVRIVTHPRFPNGPTPLTHALAVIDNLMQQPNACWVVPGKRHWELLANLCRAKGCAGKTVADAQHAVIAMEQAATFVSRDSDFLQFKSEGLRFELWAPDSE